MAKPTPQELQTLIENGTLVIPEGYACVDADELQKYLDAGDHLDLAKKIFRKVQPVFALFAGKENLGMMGLMQSVMSDPNITAKITAITNDAELKTDFETIAKIL